MQINHLIQTITISAIPILFAITLHEAAHGYAARICGDNTAHRLGRISLNPLRHIDPVGTILLPLLTLTLGGVLFGWAKPVPVNFDQLHNPKKDMFWVAIAGPASNLLMAIAWAILIKLIIFFPVGYFTEALLEMAKIGIQINVVLMVLNLLPLPPLDGGRVAISLLPHQQAFQLSKIEPYGMFILIFMAITPVLGAVLFPLVKLAESFLFFMVGI
jgi:Zn-dependent protease